MSDEPWTIDPETEQRLRGLHETLTIRGGRVVIDPHTGKMWHEEVSLVPIRGVRRAPDRRPDDSPLLVPVEVHLTIIAGHGLCRPRRRRRWLL